MKDNYNMAQENQKTELEWEHQTNHADIFAKSESSFFHKAGHVSIKCQTWSVHTCLLEKKSGHILLISSVTYYRALQTKIQQ